MSVSVGLLGNAVDSPLCAKVVAHETLLQDGVIKLGTGSPGLLRRGVSITLDDAYRIVAHISVIAEFGADVAAMSRNIQDAVFRGLGQASDLQVGAIHVRIAGVKVRNGGAALPQKDGLS